MTCLYCHGQRLVGWCGSGPILCPKCCDRDANVFEVVTAAWRHERYANATLTRALRNVRAFAKRLHRTDPENAANLLRFCEEAGVHDRILRGE